MSTVENHNERQLQMGNGLTNVIIIVPISTDGEDVFESSYPRLPSGADSEADNAEFDTLMPGV